MLFTLPLHAFVLQQHNPTKNKTIRLHKAWLLKAFARTTKMRCSQEIISLEVGLLANFSVT
jgi:hypothetical protein